MWTLRLVAAALALSGFVNSALADDNVVQVINHGVAAFEKRFEMIQNATKRIDVEYFIYNTDEAGRIFSQALVKKKQEIPSIKIRVLIDASAAVLQLKAPYITALRNHGIEVRYYNTASIITEFGEAQFRDHRKLLAVDGVSGLEAITGSRNIADEYFDMSETFNFRDRDVYVRGPLVAQMQADFDAYWNHEYTVPGPAYGKWDARARKWTYTSSELKKLKKGEKFLQENHEDSMIRGGIRQVSKAILADPRSTGTCESTTYVTDVPGYQSEKTRRVLPQIFDRLMKVPSGETLYVESPYFIMGDQKAIDEMARLKKRNIHGVLLTNSLASTDAFYVAANFDSKVSFYESIGDAEMYVFKGQTPKNNPTLMVTNGKRRWARTEKAIWGIHSKTFVFSDDAFAIGTFNLDPRSANLNSEMMVFCEGSRPLTEFVKEDIEDRIGASDLLDQDGKLPDGRSIFDGISRWKKFEYKLSIKPAQWFQHLL